MDFKLTDEQELIVDSYREYMESENWETYFHECDEKHEYPLRWVRRVCASWASTRSCSPRAMAAWVWSSPPSP